MPATTHARPKPGRTILVLAGLAVCAAIALLTFNAQREIRELGAARADNVQWSLAQVEVEFLQYVAETNARTIDVSTLKRRYDVFYSRMTTMRDAMKHYAHAHGRDEWKHLNNDNQ